jgi:transposase
MFSLNDTNRFFLYPYPTDMRKSFYSLSGIVTNEMGMQVQDGDAFVFINRSLTSLKILHAEYGGLVIYNMKLERGAIVLPGINSEGSETSCSIKWSELMMMVQGISPKDYKKSMRWEPKKVKQKQSI